MNKSEVPQDESTRRLKPPPRRGLSFAPRRLVHRKPRRAGAYNILVSNLPALILRLLRKPVLRQMIHFAAVGAVGTLVQYLVLWIGVDLLTFSPAVSSGAGYILGSVVNYVLNYKFTFRSDTPHGATAARYYAILVVGWCINTGLMWLLADRNGLNYWFAQILATGTAFLWNFAGSRLWAFKPRVP